MLLCCHEGEAVQQPSKVGAITERLVVAGIVADVPGLVLTYKNQLDSLNLKAGLVGIKTKHVSLRASYPAVCLAGGVNRLAHEIFLHRFVKARHIIHPRRQFTPRHGYKDALVVFVGGYKKVTFDIVAALVLLQIPASRVGQPIRIDLGQKRLKARRNSYLALVGR